MLACSCPKCSTYGKSSYCVNDIVEEGRADYVKSWNEYKLNHKKSVFWLKFSLWAGGICLSLPILLGMITTLSKM